MKTIEKLGNDLSRLISEKPAVPILVERVSHLLAKFVSKTSWFREFLESKLFDSDFFMSQLNTIWPNELTLLRSPDREYTVLVYIWGPHTADVIHDHGSWGVITAFRLPFSERKFRRLDDGRVEGFAELEEISHKTIEPGETTCVLPLNEGIHQILNATDDYVVSLNVYGRALRHGYVQFFNPSKKMVWQEFPPRTLKQVMAIRAAGYMAEPWAEELLSAALEKDIPDFIKDQCRLSLKQRRSSSQ